MSVSARHSASFFLCRLRYEVERLEDGQFPGHHPGPRKWLAFIKGLIDTGLNYADAAGNRRLRPVQANRLLYEAEDLAVEAYSLLAGFNASESTRIPHPVVAPLQRWAGRLGIQHPIFFSAEHEPVYELAWYDKTDYSDPFGKLASESLKKVVAETNWPIYRVTVPSKAMGMLPHFAVVAHEFGHAVSDEIFVDDNIPEYKKFRKRLDTRLTKLGVQADPVDVFTSYTDIFKLWMDELKADAVGHYLAGPAFFFALCGFLELSGRGFGVGRTHPPSSLRRQVLFEKLTTGRPSFAAAYKKHLKITLAVDISSPNMAVFDRTDPEPFEGLVQPGPNQLAPLDAAICMELPALLEAMAPAVFQETLVFLRKTCPDLIYSASDLDRDLSEHLDALCAMVPPIEQHRGGKTTPCRLATILNVGWAAMLGRLPSFGDAPKGASEEEPADQLAKLHELLLKAAELAEAKQLWEECHASKGAA